MAFKHKAGTGQVGGFRSTVEADDALNFARQVCPESYNFELPMEFHNSVEKPPLKLIPCTVCQRPMIVNTFYVLAWAKCNGSGCSGEAKGTASVPVAQAGKTEPSTAMHLDECLINEEFAEINCIKCGASMELKSVSHSDAYGPGEWVPQKGGGHRWEMKAKGETVMFQCGKCWLVTSFSTTAQHEFRRVNEPKIGGNANEWGKQLGVREEYGESFKDPRDGRWKAKADDPLSHTPWAAEEVAAGESDKAFGDF